MRVEPGGALGGHIGHRRQHFARLGDPLPPLVADFIAGGCERIPGKVSYPYLCVVQLRTALVAPPILVVA